VFVALRFSTARIFRLATTLFSAFSSVRFARHDQDVGAQEKNPQPPAFCAML
jgi:hypothetical protein